MDSVDWSCSRARDIKVFLLTHHPSPSFATLERGHISPWEAPTGTGGCAVGTGVRVRESLRTLLDVGNMDTGHKLSIYQAPLSPNAQLQRDFEMFTTGRGVMLRINPHHPVLSEAYR
jgi:hypothetical protein